MQYSLPKEIGLSHADAFSKKIFTQEENFPTG